MRSRARVPVLANIRPSGEFLMEDFYYAGGLRALMAEIRDLLHLDCLTVNGHTLGENLEGARVINRRGDSRAREAPLVGDRRHGDPVRQPRAGWRGDQDRGRRSALLAAHRTGGGVPGLSTTWRRASIATTWTWTRTPCWCCRMRVRWAVRGCPNGACCRFPQKLLAKGIRDMVRISDARMSGTRTAPASCTFRPKATWAGRWRW